MREQDMITTTKTTKTIPAKHVKVGDCIRSKEGVEHVVKDISIGTFPGRLSMTLESGLSTHLRSTMPVEVVVEA